jgi:hypothetical protein
MPAVEFKPRLTVFDVTGGYLDGEPSGVVPNADLHPREMPLADRQFDWSPCLSAHNIMCRVGLSAVVHAPDSGTDEP